MQPNDSSMARGPRQFGNMRVAVCVLLVLSMGYFTVRGPLHALKQDSDFILIYTPARAWLFGHNPYDMQVLDAVWRDAGGAIEQAPTTRVKGNLIYPPSTLLALSPWGALPWPLAKWTWIASNVIFLAAAIWGLIRLAGWRWTDNGAILFAALALAFMPVHTTFRHGQTPLVVLALVVWAANMTCSKRGGVMAGLAAAIKPQIGLPFVALDIVRGRWRAALLANGAAVAVLAIAGAVMSMRGIDWWGNWQTNLANFTGTGEGDPTAANPLRSQLLFLAYGLHTFIADRSAVRVFSLGICAAIAAVFFLWSPIRSAKKADSTKSSAGATVASAASDSLLLSVSMVAVLSLLVVYHRFYDAVLLLIPLAWAVSSISAGRVKVHAWAVIVLLLPFFANSTAMLFDAAWRGVIPESLAKHAMWEVLIMPHQVWALLAMAMVLVSVKGRQGRRPH